MDDDQDPYVDSSMTPNRSVYGKIPVGIPFLAKLLIVRWLQARYDLPHDQAMQDADELEKYMERNK